LSEEKNQKKKETALDQMLEKYIIRAAPVSKEPPTPQPKKKDDKK